MSFKNYLGFSLMEIMVAMGIMGIISVGTMKLMDNAHKGNKKVENRMEAGSNIRLLDTTLLSDGSCTHTLKNLAIGSTLTDIKNSSGNAVHRNASQCIIKTSDYRELSNT